MKIMLVCAGGMSTGILMRKLEKWGLENHQEIVVQAYALSEYESEWMNYDVVLLGPQVSYKLDEISRKANIPVAQIASLDYALGKVENIVKQVDTLIRK